MFGAAGFVSALGLLVLSGGLGCSGPIDAAPLNSDGSIAIGGTPGGNAEGISASPTNPRGGPSNGSTAENTVAVDKLSELEAISPGTVVTDTACNGFSHLLLKTEPEFCEEALKVVYDITSETASVMFTAYAADVQKGPGGHRLSRVAVGVGQTVDKGDMILTCDACKELGVDLSFSRRCALSAAQEYVDKSRTLGRTATMMIFDAPTVLNINGQNRDALFRYAVLAHPKDGRVATLVWALRPAESKTASNHDGPVSEVRVLPSPYLDQCLLAFDANECTMGIPGRRAYAPISVPQGDRCVPADCLPTDVATACELPLKRLPEIEAKLRCVLFRVDE